METPRESFRKIMHYEQPERMYNWNRPFGFFGGGPGTQFWQNTVDRWHEEGLPAEIYKCGLAMIPDILTLNTVS